MKAVFLQAAFIYSGLAMSKVSAEDIDCVGFARFSHSASGDHLTYGDFFRRYFKRDLPTQSEEQIDRLIKWAADCDDHFNIIASELSGTGNTDASNWYELSRWLSFGIQDLNDIAAQKKQELRDQQSRASLASASEHNLRLIAEIPKCNDDVTISALNYFVSNSDGGHVIRELKNFSDVSSPAEMGLRVCRVDALLDVGEQLIEFGVKWRDKPAGQLTITLF